VSKITIPERYRAGVAKIGGLDDPTVLLIRSALDAVIGSVEASDVPAIGERPDSVAATALASIAPTIAEADFKQIADTLNALYGVRSSRDVPVEKFAEDVADAMESLEKPLRLEPARRSEFVSKLTILLSAEVFGIVSKAWDLRTDDERVFCHARIITDLRPVFGQNVESGPKAMVVVHLLKLAFHRGSERHQEFYVSLDGDDLTTLRNLIDRAEEKAKTLKSCIKDVKLFGVPAEE
jgi:hypothetical protein